MENRWFVVRKASYLCDALANEVTRKGQAAERTLHWKIAPAERWYNRFETLTGLDMP